MYIHTYNTLRESRFRTGRGCSGGIVGPSGRIDGLSIGGRDLWGTTAGSGIAVDGCMQLFSLYYSSAHTYSTQSTKANPTTRQRSSPIPQLTNHYASSFPKNVPSQPICHTYHHYHHHHYHYHYRYHYSYREKERKKESWIMIIFSSTEHTGYPICVRYANAANLCKHAHIHTHTHAERDTQRMIKKNTARNAASLRRGLERWGGPSPVCGS